MNEFRQWGHKLIDWVADYLESPERYPVLSAISPNDIVNALPARGPEQGEPMESIFADFERVIDVDHRNPGIWTKYAEMEMKAKFALYSLDLQEVLIGTPRPMKSGGDSGSKHKTTSASARPEAAWRKVSMA